MPGEAIEGFGCAPLHAAAEMSAAIGFRLVEDRAHGVVLPSSSTKVTVTSASLLVNPLVTYCSV